MPVRWYVSEIVGDGRSRQTSFRPACAVQGVSWTAVIPSLPTGRPRATWALVKVDATAAQHATLGQDSRNVALPNVALDVALPTQARAGLRAALVAKGVPEAVFDQAITGGGSLRSLVRAAGQMLEASYDEARHGVRGA